jgi:hypothetical protein
MVKWVLEVNGGGSLLLLFFLWFGLLKTIPNIFTKHSKKIWGNKFQPL